MDDPSALDPIGEQVLDAEWAAGTHLRRHWPHRDRPVEPAEIARALQIEVRTVALDDGVRGVLRRTGERATIDAAPDLTVRQQRAVVAHALGHDAYRGSRGVVDSHVACGRHVITVEAEEELFADAFSILLRMPEAVMHQLTLEQASKAQIAKFLEVGPGEIGAYGRLQQRATRGRAARRVAYPGRYGPPPDLY